MVRGIRQALASPPTWLSMWKRLPTSLPNVPERSWTHERHFSSPFPLRQYYDK